MAGIAGKRALITGGGSGIGLGIAKKLIKNGATVYIAARNKERLDRAAKESGDNMISLQCDISNWSQTRKIIQDILPIQLLINNAGTHVVESALEATESSYNTVMNTNLKGAINLTQLVANDLIEKNIGGRVVNISSVASTRATHKMFAYCCSKAALDMATKCFALELGPKNIRVNSVNPITVPTDMAQDLLSHPKFKARVISRIPQGRIATVEDVSNAAMFLLSDDSDMINGQIILVDGGFCTS